MSLSSRQLSDLEDPNPFDSIPLKHTRYALQDLSFYMLFAWGILKRDRDVSR
jgi:hypothetical protein